MRNINMDGRDERNTVKIELKDSFPILLILSIHVH
jgi:hypothetical protein